MRLRQIMHFHDEQAVIDGWQRSWGRLLTGFTPVRRRIILALAAVWVCIDKPVEKMLKTDSVPLPADGFGMALVVLMLFALSWLCYRAAAGFKQLPDIVRRHPQWTLHLIYWGLLALLWATAISSGLWRFQHALRQRLRLPVTLRGQERERTGAIATYRYQAATACRLMADRAENYGGGCIRPRGLTHANTGGYSLGIPKLGPLIKDGAGTSLRLAWTSIYCELIYQVLYHAIRGHQIIAVLRLFVFNVFRNTYKPLLAESISEFWNRYYYYFRELLVNFFFLPTFAQLGKRPLVNEDWSKRICCLI